ncbi:uncharacterized protein BT62DRAFT_938786 [Guyanagaster necrorhizus]|uniref:Uncharacterized protein n=1 Tax=Guyanagaster necrorhizus TaxID=856835 RepID=A0A9P7VEU6_9AGAR|nr:uncharacterized protein BT62DRAFT_938786 [Guyanagaster necrorhizus MCA 3950]KAG7439636.1 hypothetical protein BT62DRAFT_938786 [Guyanagaster necrorhizus MCA 3950]
MRLVADLKTNQETPRVHSHRGNTPTLLKTKHCPLCPAKFTRTTHLNRHFGSHTNEREHRCEICGAEFNRSDVLARHKRTCGGPLGFLRSRRKSCQACADSKVKCNLDSPCSKCISRSRECVYVNDPAVSQEKKNNAKRRRIKRRIQTELLDDNSQEPLSSPITSSDPLQSPQNSEILPSFDPTLSVAADATPSSSFTSLNCPSLSAIFDPVIKKAVTIADADGELCDDSMERSFSSGVLDDFLDKSSFSTTATLPKLPWFPANGASGLNVDYSSLIASSSGFVSISTLSDNETPFCEIFNPSSPYTVSSGCADLLSRAQPLDIENEQYLHLFFSAFCTQIPLVHLGSWTTEDKPLILIHAMQACGALFLKTRRAVSFITETLSSTRDAVIHDFIKVPCSLKEQDFLILAVVLLQTIGLFHQRSDFRVSSNVYHGMLVMMIRGSEAIARSRSWTFPDSNDPLLLEQSWRNWALHETVKRALLLSYLHDCCHSVFFSMHPSFQTAEFNMNLPCDEAIWKAQTAAEWIGLLQKPSPYGLGSARLYGVGMQQALANLSEMRLKISLTPLNPFSHFILIHTILRNVCFSYSGCESSGSDAESSTAPEPMGNDGRGGNRFATQYALTNWFSMWMSCPDGKERDEEPPFVHDALPFYWLAQILLLAIRQGETGGVVKNRFHVMKEWLDHIRSFLRKHKELPSNLWDELELIRHRVSHAETTALEDHSNGLLSFFPEY